MGILTGLSAEVRTRLSPNGHQLGGHSGGEAAPSDAGASICGSSWTLEVSS